MNFKEMVAITVSDDGKTVAACEEYFRAHACKTVLNFSDDEKLIEYLEAGRPAHLVVVDTELPHHAGFSLIPFLASGQFAAAKSIWVLPIVGSEMPGVADAMMMAQHRIQTLLRKPVTERGLSLRLREQTALSLEAPVNREFLAQIMALLQKAQYAEALKSLEDELVRHPSVARYHALHIRLLQEVSLEEKADGLARKLIPKAEHYAPLMLAMATLQAKRKNFPESLTYLEKAAHFVPVHAERLLLQAEDDLVKANYPSAISRLRHAEKMLPRCEAVRAGLVRVLAAMGRLEDARALQKEMEDPTEPYQSQILRGVLLAQAGHHAEAIGMYQAAMPILAESSKAPVVLYNIALGHFKLRQYGNCREVAQRCLSTSPQFERARDLLAKAEAAQKGGPTPAAPATPAALSLTPAQLDFLSHPRFVRRSGLPFPLEPLPTDEEFDEEGNVAKKKVDTGTLKYDTGELKHSHNVFRGGK